MIMKARYFFIALTMFAVSMVSCSREEGSVSSVEGPVLTFTAVNADSKDTKTALQDNGTSIWWMPNEQINVFRGAGFEGMFTSGNTDPQAITTFSGSLNPVAGSVGAGEADAYWAVYPYDAANTCDGESVCLTVPSVQAGVAGTFADNFFPAVAKSATLDLAFYNVCGGACISVSQTGITEIIIKSADGTPVTGKVKVGFGDDGKPVVKSVIQGQDQLSLLAPAGGFVPGELYYAALLPGTHAQGIMIGYSRADFSGGTKVLGNSVTVHRSVFGRLFNLDDGLQFTMGGGLKLGPPQGSGTADDPYNVAAACTIAGTLAPDESIDDVYTKGIVSSILKYYPDEGLVAYFIQDEGYGATLEAWKGFYLAGTKFTDENQLKVGDEVIIKGQLLLYNNIQPEYAKRNKIVWLNGVKEYDAYPSSPSTLNDALTLPENSHITIDDVTVVAKSAMGFVVSNGEHNLHVFDSDYKKVSIGDKVALDGVMILYCGLPEMVSATASVSSSGNDLPRTDLVDITGVVDTYTAAESDYVSVSGLMVYMQDSYYVIVDGGSRICSITNKPNDLDLDAFVGKLVILKGYYCNFDTYSNAHMIIYSSIEERPAPVAVDLGLSVKWATFNLGAGKPEECGDYYAWGETQPQSDYMWSSYKWCKGEISTLTKYNINPLFGTVDYKTVLDPEDDAAHVNWGGNWRMPTKEEQDELRDNCTWTRTEDYNGTGVSGMIVTSNKPGYTDKSIFLPAAGDIYDSELRNVGSSGYYWSSSLKTDTPDYAYYVYFNSRNVRWFDNYRHVGKSIRPVYGEVVPVSSISIPATVELPRDKSATLTPTILPENATYKNLTWISSDESVATVDATGTITARAEGKATITVYSADASVMAACEVFVIAVTIPNGYEYVDLGLPSGLKWATMNVGASKPEECGDYYAWGETEPKSDYSWATYKFRISGDGSWDGHKSNITFSKYCNQSSNWESSEPMDNKTVLDLEDDAAHVNWGGSWRMPTYEEYVELLANCTWTRSTQNGVNGLLVSGPNGNSIFFPAAGSIDDSELHGVGSWCYFWSSSLYTERPSCAWYVDFTSDSGRGPIGRNRGYSVRPVIE